MTVNSKRDMNIVRMREGGNIYRVIADAFGLSVGRIRQIILRHKVRIQK